MDVNPRVLFERLFGDGDSTDPAARMAALRERGSLLDFVKGSVDRLETRLDQGDRRKLTEYLDAIRDIERRIQKAEEQNATLKMPVIHLPVAAPEEFVRASSPGRGARFVIRTEPRQTSGVRPGLILSDLFVHPPRH